MSLHLASKTCCQKGDVDLTTHSRLVCELVELLSGDWLEERADLLVVAVCLQSLEDPNVYDTHRLVAACEVEALDEVGRPLEEGQISGRQNVLDVGPEDVLIGEKSTRLHAVLP